LKRVEDLPDRAGLLGRRLIVLSGHGNRTSNLAAIDAVETGLARLLVVTDSTSVAVAPEVLEHAEDVIPAVSEDACAKESIAAARQHDNSVLLKGSLHSSVLLRAIIPLVHDEHPGNVLSDVLLLNDPFSGPDSRGLLGITDGGINVRPDLVQKEAICRNAVFVFHALGYDRPRIAALSATEVPTPSVPSSMDAVNLKDAAESGRLGDCVFDGPLAMDLAKAPDALAAKGLSSPVQGRADILLMPNVEAGNILGKALYWLGYRPAAHVAVGGSFPVLIPSRSEDSRSKLCSIALASLLAGREGLFS